MKALGWAVLLAAAPASACPGLQVDDGWIREPVPGVAVTAGYGRLHNGGAAELVVSGARSPDFGAVELHRTVIEDGMTRMRHGGALVLAPGQALALEPGGWHLMLFRPARALRPGERVRIVLECGAPGAEFMFTVRTAG